MDYREAKQGRVFVARLSEGESIYEAVEDLAGREKLKAAAVWALGGMRRGAVVTGPEDPAAERDIVGHVERFDDARELVGFGTVFPLDGRPTLHFHAGMGRGREALVGCPREAMETFLILEVVVLELAGLDAARNLDPVSGFHLLDLGGGA